MPGDLMDPPVDYVTLAEFLKTLGSPVRLELLRMLRFPRTLGEIEIKPHRRQSGRNPERTVSRQTVQGHLDKLVEAGLVNIRPAQQRGRQVPSYAVDPTRVYALTEDLRSLSTLYAGQGLADDRTGTLDRGAEPREVSGPKLVLVHGVYEGKPFPLRADRSRGASSERWVIGRADDASVGLDYDPYVSTEHASIERRGDEFVVEDLGSKNGTWVNWSPLVEGTERVLKPADVIGVGRSLLCFAPE